MKNRRHLLGLTLTMCVGLGLTSPARAQVSQEVDVPVVNCPVDGQVGPQALKGPRSIRKNLPQGQASRLAYYRGLYGLESAVVLGPRGWKCIGRYGSNGGTVSIYAPQANPGRDGRYQGPVVEVRVRYGGTSGRISVASTAGPLFKVAASFIDEVEANFPATQKYRRVPWPNEKVSPVNDRLVTYVTPPASEGTGTQGGLAVGSLPIHGVVAFTEESNLFALAARLDGDDTALIPTILSDFQTTLTQLLKPTNSATPPTAPPGAPPKLVAPPAALSPLAVGQVVMVDEPAWACLPKDEMRLFQSLRELIQSSSPPQRQIHELMSKDFFQKKVAEGSCRIIPRGTEVRIVEEDGPLVRAQLVYAGGQPLWMFNDALKR